ncbi:MAG: hypothetical protein LW832_04460 [Parachlamydia sp.]|jgi:hypothetical protein|nr:hypothetical protein [Parachlamydia sp.]
MIIDKSIKYILDQLPSGDTVHLPFEGLDIMLKYYPNSQLALMTSVYTGDNYIPQSVRNSLSGHLPYSHPSIRTYFLINEETFNVSLNYLGNTDILDRQTLFYLIEEFAIIAEKWRHYLDEKDRTDLIPVKVS